MKSSKKKALTVTLGAILMVVTIGITYAFVNQVLTGTKEVVINAGVLDLVLEEENAITISDALPMYDEVGMIQEPFTFRLVNNGKSAVNYKLKLIPLYTKVDTTQKCSDLGEITLASPAECRKTSYPEKLKNDVLNLCKEMLQPYSITTPGDVITTSMVANLNVSSFEDVIDLFIMNGMVEDTRVLLETYPDNLVKSYVPFLNANIRCGVTKNGKSVIDDLSKIIIKDGELELSVIDSGTISGNETIDYELRLWLDAAIEDISSIEGKSFSFKLEVQASQDIQYLHVKKVSDLVSDGINLGDKCEIYDDGADTYLVGKCPNNHVLYSGKLWRVVSKNNETGAVKMTTENIMTAIPYNNENNSSYENSYVDQWLTQEFLPTLHDTSKYLVEDSKWYVASDSGDIPIKPSGASITRTVGLLNYYEYHNAYAATDILSYIEELSYLNNDMYQYLITPYDDAKIRFVASYNEVSKTSPEYGAGVRPTVNFKPAIDIVGGNGTATEPYILENDLQETINGITLLNTKYIGDFVKFNDGLYRIVEINNGIVKITATNEPDELDNVPFHSTSDVISFADADIKRVLEDYYQNLKNTNENVYNMIEPNTMWYLGTVGYGTNYKASICANIDTTKSMNMCEEKANVTTTNIGLPRVGELFTFIDTYDPVSDGYDVTWSLSPHSETKLRINELSGLYGLGNMNAEAPYGALPSMYLKQNVVIASDNTGNGTYEKPYSIELGQ